MAMGRSRAWWMPLDPELVAGEVPGKCLLAEVSIYQDSSAGITSPEFLCGCRVLLVRSLRLGAAVAAHRHKACDMSAFCQMEADVVIRP